MAAVRFSAAGEVLYAYLSGEVDHDAAQSLRIQLDDALVSRTPQTLVLDFSGVGFMDSSGIGLILGRQRSARTLGTTLQIQHAPAQLRRVLQLAGIRCTDASKTEEGPSLIPSASTTPTPAASWRPFWPGTTPRCPSWQTSRPLYPRR